MALLRSDAVFALLIILPTFGGLIIFGIAEVTIITLLKGV